MKHLLVLFELDTPEVLRPNKPMAQLNDELICYLTDSELTEYLDRKVIHQLSNFVFDLRNDESIGKLYKNVLSIEELWEIYGTK